MAKWEMGKLFTFLWTVIWLVPMLLFFIGAALSLPLSRCRWIVHVLIFAAMLLVLPAMIYVQVVLETDPIEGDPHLGEGLAAGLYLVVMVVSAICYAVFAWALNHERKYQERKRLLKSREK